MYHDQELLCLIILATLLLFVVLALSFLRMHSAHTTKRNTSCSHNKSGIISLLFCVVRSIYFICVGFIAFTLVAIVASALRILSILPGMSYYKDLAKILYKNCICRIR